MRRDLRVASVFAVVALLNLGACGQDLTHKNAVQVIKTNSALRASDNVTVDAISNSGSAEAIVKSTINGSTLTLKFRRYDSGWAWESVETQGGSWIAPEAAIGQIREVDRQKRIEVWARENSEPYAATVRMMNKVTDELPSLDTVSFSVSGWMQTRRNMAQIWRDLAAENRRNPKAFPSGADPERLEASAKLLDDVNAADAWGRSLLASFDVADHEALILSAGPDGMKGTTDDLTCLAVGHSVYEGRTLWRYVKKWSVPEGLQAVMADYVGAKSGGSAEYVKLIKP
jgi:hypothetical protein